MLRRAAAVLALLSATACSRDLDVPSANRLGIEPGSWSLAPRESKTFVGVGGAAGYTFGFLNDAPLSGSDATIDAHTGAYRAGSIGSAQDVVQITDAAGATAFATVNVGQRVAIAPPLTATLPGMRTVFSATGGSPAYTYSLEYAPSGGTIDPLTGSYSAGPVGSVKDVVLVHDHLNDPAAVARAEVAVGGAIAAFRSVNSPVAPHESVTLFAIGGKPPYRFTIESATSGSLLDPADAPTVTANLTQSTVLYTAGNRLHEVDPSAVTSDVVRVTDSADVPQTTTVVVTVGPRISLALDTGAAYPGVTAHLVATGGKPPYTFGFSARVPATSDPTRSRGGNGGNRSGGTVSSFTGDYVPGASPGAVDWFQVTDATGAPAAVLQGPPVGGTLISIPRGLDTCFVGDIDGDLAEDVVFTYKGDGGLGARIVTSQYLSTPAPVTRSIHATLRTLGSMAPNDVAQRRRDSFLLAGAASYEGSRDLVALDADLAGNLSERQVAFGPYGMQAGVLILDPGLAPTAVLTDGNAGTCSAAGNDRTFLRWDWAPGAASPASVPVCRTVTGGCVACGGNFQTVVAMAAGDFNGDGVQDLVYISRNNGSLDYAAPSTGGRLYVAFGAGTPGAAPTSFSATGHAGWPAEDPAGGEWRFEARNQRSEAYLLVARAPLPGQRDTALVRLIDAAGEGRIFALHDPAAGWAGPFDPTGSGHGASGLRKIPTPAGTEAFFSVDGSSGDVVGFDVTGAGSAVPGLARGAVAATLPFSASVACFPDVNGDGIRDLVVASELGAQAQVLLGDGSNSQATGAAQSFGARTHLRGMGFPVAVGDLDGDGFVDVAAAEPGSGLDVLFGGGGMLAWGPRVSTAPINAVAIADLGRGRPSVLFQDLVGAYGVVHVRADGTFEPAVAVTATTADSKAVSPVYLLLWPADLGTSAAGVDFLSIDPSSTGWFTHAILNQGSRLVDVKSPPIPPADGTHTVPDQCWPLPVGVGQGALAMLCNYDDQAPQPAGISRRNLVTLWGTHVVSPDAAPTANGVGAPAIAPWVPAITSTTAAPWRVSVPLNTKPTFVGTVQTATAGGPPAGTAVFMMRSDRLYVVEVWLSGDPALAASWHVQALPVPGALQLEPNLGVLGRLDPSGGSAFDLVVGTGAGVIVLRRSTQSASYSVVQTLSTLQFPMGIGRLAAGSPGDVVGVVTDLGFGGASTTEIVPLLNVRSAAGAFQGWVR